MLFRFGMVSVLACAAFSQQVKIEFSAEKRETVQSRLGQAPDSNEARAAGVRKLFEEAGCTGAVLEDQAVKGSTQPNVICSSKGENGSVILVGAHFDFSGKGKGVVDNWTGAALLPTLFQTLQKSPRKHTFVFVEFTDEEKGLKGSSFYVNHLTGEQRAAVKAMINLDSLGLASSNVWIAGSDKGLAGRLASVAKALNIPLHGVNVERVGTADSQPFMDKKVPAVTIHSVTQENLSVLHSAKDQVSAVNMDSYYETYRLVSAYLVYLDQMLD